MGFLFKPDSLHLVERVQEMLSGLEYWRVGRAVDELAFAVLAEPNLAVDEALAAQIDLLRDTLDRHAFIDVIVGLHVVGAGADGMRLVGIPDDNVGIGSNGDGAFLWITAENFGWIGAIEFDKAVGRDFAAVYAQMPHDHQAVFDTGHTVGDFGEIALAEFLAGTAVAGVLLFVGDPVATVMILRPLLPRTHATFIPEVAVIGADGLQCAFLDRLSENFVMFFVADGR